MRGQWRVFILTWASLLLFCCIPSPGRSQYEVEERSPVWLRGLLDVRVARGGPAPSWTDRGPGKARYGGRFTNQGFERVTRLALSRLAIEVGVSLPWGIEARAQVDWETDIDNDDRPLLIEALLRKEWGRWENGWGIQTGVMNLPFSLEHSGPAVTPLYTLTPSALSTWIWEEGRVVGLAADWWRVASNGLRLDVVLGGGFGPDQIGRLLALRGWALSDALAGVNSDLPLPNPRLAASIFDERDHRPSVYSTLTIGEEKERFSLRLGYFDSLGDQGTTGAWETRFGAAGILLRPFGRVEMLAQYLEGSAMVRGGANDTGFSGFYILLSQGYQGHRFSVRYESFRTTDHDGAPFSREHGDGVTLAYLFEFGLHHRLGFEYIFLHSRRPALFHSDPGDDGWQVSYRFRY